MRKQSILANLAVACVLGLAIGYALRMQSRPELPAAQVGVLPFAQVADLKRRSSNPVQVQPDSQVEASLIPSTKKMDRVANDITATAAKPSFVAPRLPPNSEANLVASAPIASDSATAYMGISSKPVSQQEHASLVLPDIDAPRAGKVVVKVIEPVVIPATLQAADRLPEIVVVRPGLQTQIRTIEQIERGSRGNRVSISLPPSRT